MYHRVCKILFCVFFIIGISFALTIHPSRACMYRSSISLFRNNIFRSAHTCLRMSSTVSLPALPNKALSSLGETLQKKMLVDLQLFEAEIQAEEAQKEGFFKLSRAITVASHEMLQLVRNGEVDRMESLIDENRNNILKVRVVTSIVDFFL